MNIKHSQFLTVTLLVLAVIAAAIVPAVGASAFKAESADGNCVVYRYDFSDEEMEFAGYWPAEGKQIDFREHLKKSLDEKVAAGVLTKEEADNIYASLENCPAITFTVGASTAGFVPPRGQTAVYGSFGPMTTRHFDKDFDFDKEDSFVTVRFESNLKDGAERFNVHYAAGFRLDTFSEEELDALKGMTDDERKEFLDSRFKAELDKKVAAGELTQEEADEMYATHTSGVGQVLKFNDGQCVGIKITKESDDDFLTFEKITTDNNGESFLSRFGPIWIQRLIR